MSCGGCELGFGGGGSESLIDLLFLLLVSGEVVRKRKVKCERIVNEVKDISEVRYK